MGEPSVLAVVSGPHGGSVNRYYLCISIIFVLSFHALAEAGEAVEALLTEENQERLEAGEYLLTFEKIKKEGESCGQGTAIMLANSSADTAWHCLTQFKKHPEFMPHVVGSEIYFKEADTVALKQTIKIAFKKVSYHVIQHLDHDKHILTWELDKTKPNGIKDTRGSWQIRPYDESRCMLIYTVSADSGMPIPSMIEDFLLKQDLPNVVKAMKTRAENHS